MAKAGRGADQYMLRFPPGLRDRIKAYAERHGRSMNTEIIRILEREFPEPWPIGQRIGDLLEMLTVLKSGGATDERIAQLVREVEETVAGLYSGRIRDVDEQTRDSIRAAFEWWQEQAAEAEQDSVAMDLDEDEIASLQRTGRTEKFEDPFGE